MNEFREVKAALSEKTQLELMELAKLEKPNINDLSFIEDIGKVVSAYKIRLDAKPKKPSIAESLELLKLTTDLIAKLNSKLQLLHNDPSIISSIDKLMFNRLLNEHSKNQEKLAHIQYPTFEFLKTATKHINDLNDLLNACLNDPKLMSKGGRPNKDIRKMMIRDIAEIYKSHVSNPSLTVDGPFERFLKLCFEEAGDYFEDIHKLALSALKKPKVQKPTINPS